jgi:RHS repeat-associated protein
LVSVTTSDKGTVEFEYDLGRRMVARRGRTGSETFRYDDVGNPHESGPTDPARVYDPGSRLKLRGNVEYEYDARGRLAAKHVRLDDGAQKTTRYRYDSFDLLRTVELPDYHVVHMVYDAFARRVEKRVTKKDGQRTRTVSTTHYIWDQVSVVHEIESNAKGAREVTTFLYEDPSDTVPIAERGAGNWLHYVHELNGAPEEIVDGEGRIVTRASHSAFGVWRWSQSTTDVAVPFRFPGQLEDAETGLLYNRYRTYDPETGRFLTPDPIGLDGGLNLYGYGPNPVAWIDPMGWRHHMTVTRAPRGFNAAHASARTPGGPQYQSGMHNCPGGPPASENLQSRARCHTEQKFAHDLIQSGQRYQGQDFTLSGELPPCPNCHRALQHAADRSGANIQYQWTGPDGRP